MNPSELKYNVEQTGSHFFDRDSMKFFGDTMKNYGCCRVVGETRDGEFLEVYQLYRKRPVKHGQTSAAYFEIFTFKERHDIIAVRKP